jgi:hypothetical protein
MSAVPSRRFRVTVIEWLAHEARRSCTPILT